MFPRVLRLDKGQAVPADTPLGTVIVRTERAISHADDLFPPIGEEEAQVNLWTARRYQEEGHPAQVDQGSKIADLTVRKGDHLELSLEIEPRKVDEKIGDVWGVWMDAPIPVLYVHDLVIRKIA